MPWIGTVINCIDFYLPSHFMVWKDFLEFLTDISFGHSLISESILKEQGSPWRKRKLHSFLGTADWLFCFDRAIPFYLSFSLFSLLLPGTGMGTILLLKRLVHLLGGRTLNWKWLQHGRYVVGLVPSSYVLLETTQWLLLENIFHPSWTFFELENCGLLMEIN